MNSVKNLENKILECTKHADEFINDYEKIVLEVRELKKTIERLQAERKELRRRIDDVVESVENHVNSRT